MVPLDQVQYTCFLGASCLDTDSPRTGGNDNGDLVKLARRERLIGCVPGNGAADLTIKVSKPGDGSSIPVHPTVAPSSKEDTF